MTIEELKRIKEQTLPQINMRHTHTVENETKYKHQVLVCGGTGCTSSGSGKLIDEFKAQVSAHGIEDEVQIVRTGCFGLCELGPIVIVYPEGVFYAQCKTENVKRIVEEHIIGGKVIDDLVYHEKTTGEVKEKLSDMQFYKKQSRIALRNCGVVDPEKIEDYAFIGELSLDGKIRGVNGVLPIILGLKKSGIKNVIVPAQNANEAALADGINIYGAEHLTDVVNHFTETPLRITKVDINHYLNAHTQDEFIYDFKDVKGQKKAKIVSHLVRHLLTTVDLSLLYISNSCPHFAGQEIY